MGKPSGFVLQVQRAQAAKVEEARLFTLQQCKDLAMIAAAEMFGMDPKRANQFSQIYDEIFTEYATMVVEDTKEIEYSKVKIDEKLQRICGENFMPFDERYEMKTLTNRYDRRREKKKKG